MGWRYLKTPSAIMSDTTRSILLGTSWLSILAVAALVTTLLRYWMNPLWLTRERFVRMFRISAAVEAIHFVEEWSTGFHVRFPALFGLAPWPDRFFAVLCIALVVLWLVAAPALVRGKRPALFVAWFLRSPWWSMDSAIRYWPWLVSDTFRGSSHRRSSASADCGFCCDCLT